MSKNNQKPAAGYTATDFHDISQSNDAAVIFYPWVYENDNDTRVTSANFLDTTEVHVSAEIFSVTTNKPKGDVGTWEVMLSSNRNWCSILHPSAWCLIYISDTQISTKNPDGLKMVGIIKSVREIEMVDGNGTRQVRYKVSGVDFHSVLHNQVYINPAILAEGTNEASLDYLANQFQNVAFRNPSQVIESLFEVMIGQPLITNVDGTTSASPLFSKVPTVRKVPPAMTARFLGTATPQSDFTAFMVRNIQDNLIGNMTTAPLVTNGATFWSMVETYSHRVVNECYTDLIHAKNANGDVTLIPTMVLRAIPFSSKYGYPDPSCLGYHAYARRPTISTFSQKGISADVLGADTYYLSRVIRDYEILSFDKGKSDAERFNMILLTPNLTTDQNQNKGIVSYALFANGEGLYQYSIQRNGLRMHLGSSIYLLDPTTSDADTDILNRILRDMWSNAYLFENGSVNIPGKKDHIPVGTAIEFADRNLVGHVENVAHSFAVVDPNKGTKQFRTSIMFSRLQRIVSSDSAPVDETGNSSTAGKQGKWDRGVNLVRIR